mgnify:CR=1 FL=1
MINILGISCFYHDSAAALISNGKIVAAAQEERFTRKKHDPRFPANAIRYCIEEADLYLNDINYIVYYDNPIFSFDRLLSTFIYSVPKGIKNWVKFMPKFFNQKFELSKIIKQEIGWDKNIEISKHHLSHAASAFYPSPFKEAAILTMDGVGEWATASYGLGKDSKIKILSELRYPNSVGLLYSAFTYFCGFRVNSGEYKLMGLAPYGVPKYKDIIMDKLVDIKNDGSVALNLEYFGFMDSTEMINRKFAELFGGPKREPETKLRKREMDIAASIQVVTEEIILKMAYHVKHITGMKNLCLAGGVALNCVANGKILKEKIFDDIWIQPASGDAGGALGAAFAFYYMKLKNERLSDKISRPDVSTYFGPCYSQNEVEIYLKDFNINYHVVNEDEKSDLIAKFLIDGKIIGNFSGRMEFGPRALGARSILGDPRREDTQKTLNLKIKFRESFRPFAPVVLEEKVGEYFDLDCPSPYMLLVAPVRKHRCYQSKQNNKPKIMSDWINEKRSDIPAVTHVDYSARIQTISKKHHSKFYDVVKKFYDLTGCPVLVNTSFNVRGEPIVCSPEDAYKCFMRTKMDILVLENCILYKEEQPEWEETHNWREDYELD